jgi:hypothetical protein
METTMERTSLRIAAIFGIIMGIPAAGRAADLFGVEVTYGGGTISQSASSLPDLVEALTKNQDAFAPLVGQDFTGSLTYYGIPGAVSVHVQGDTQLTVTSPLTGLNRTFTGTNRDDLEQQLKDWLLKEGGRVVAELMKAAAKESTAAIIDGNPSAATARMADRAFSTFGLYPATPAMRGSTKGSYLGLWADAKRSTADTPVGSVDSSQYGFNVPWWLDFSSKVSLIGNLSGQYMDAEGTAIYGGGMDLGLGIRLASRGENDRFGWQVTPFAGLHGVGTYDGASGGLLDHFGIANRFEFMLNQDVQLVVASQFSYYDSLKLKIQEVEIDPELNQQVVKNAVMLDTPVGSAKWLHVNGFAMDTRFLKDVAVDGYQTVGGGLSMRKGHTSLNGYVGYDIADNYNSWNFGVGLGFDW